MLQFAREDTQGLDINASDPQERRSILDKIAASGPPERDAPAKDLLSVTTFTVSASDEYQIPVRSYIPRTETATTGGFPLLIYFHGGGWAFGSIESGDLNCQTVCARLGVTVVNVDYRLAPRWKFPRGFEDSYEAVRWAVQNADSLEVDLGRGLIIGGISSGANFAGAIAYRARQDSTIPPITGLVLSVPAALMPQAYGLTLPQWSDELLSMELNKDAPLLSKEVLLRLYDQYGAPADDPRMSFLLDDKHDGLPPRAYVQVCGLDVLRDEGLLWTELARQGSGTESRVDVYSGLPHGFWRFRQMRVSREWLDDLLVGVRYVQGEGGAGLFVKGVE